MRVRKKIEKFSKVNFFDAFPNIFKVTYRRSSEQQRICIYTLLYSFSTYAIFWFFWTLCTSTCIGVRAVLVTIVLSCPSLSLSLVFFSSYLRLLPIISLFRILLFLYSAPFFHALPHSQSLLHSRQFNARTLKIPAGLHPPSSYSFMPPVVAWRPIS